MRSFCFFALLILISCGQESELPTPPPKAGSVEISNHTDKDLYGFLVLVNGVNPGLDMAGVGAGASKTFGFFPGPALRGHAVITFQLAIPDGDYEGAPAFRYEGDLTEAQLSHAALDTISFQIGTESCRIVGQDKADRQVWAVVGTPVPAALPPGAKPRP